MEVKHEYPTSMLGDPNAPPPDYEKEAAYWRDHYRERPYVAEGDEYDAYEPAYRVGYEGRTRYSDRSFEDAETSLRSDYESSVSSAGLAWERVKDAVHDAWDRVAEYLPGNDDTDNSVL